MKSFIALIGLVFMINSPVAFADENRMYFQATGMLSSFNDMEHNSGDLNDTIVVQDGMGLSAAIGYKFSNRLRGEIEYSYREANVESFTADEKWGFTKEQLDKMNKQS